MRIASPLSLTLLLVAPLAAQTLEPTKFERTGMFANPRLVESSGVAASRTQEGVLWTHNDSGDGPFLYATNRSGADLGVYRVEGAEAEDWEDIALGPCPSREPPRACLYIGDTGDNLEHRRSVQIYVVPEPTLRGAPSAARTAPAMRLEITYPDGPHDVEALAVAPSGFIALISKERNGKAHYYRIPPVAPGQHRVIADLMGLLTFPSGASLASRVTGAAFSPDGSVLAVRTYAYVAFFRPDSGGALRQVGDVCALGWREPQGEGIDFEDDSTLVLTSESALGRAGGITLARCPRPATTKHEGLNR